MVIEFNTDGGYEVPELIGRQMFINKPHYDYGMITIWGSQLNKLINRKVFVPWADYAFTVRIRRNDPLYGRVWEIGHDVDLVYGGR